MKKKKSFNEWLNLLESKKAWAYMKPAKGNHESGWGVFEVGYMTINKDNKMDEKYVLSKYSDHVYLNYIDVLVNKIPIPVNMDLTLDGYIRIWDHGEILCWEKGNDWALSSVSLGIYKPKNKA